jgi:hypothetical protein
MQDMGQSEAWKGRMPIGGNIRDVNWENQSRTEIAPTAKRFKQRCRISTPFCQWRQKLVNPAILSRGWRPVGRF